MKDKDVCKSDNITFEKRWDSGRPPEYHYGTLIDDLGIDAVIMNGHLHLHRRIMSMTEANISLSMLEIILKHPSLLQNIWEAYHASKDFVVREDYRLGDKIEFTENYYDRRIGMKTQVSKGTRGHIVALVYQDGASVMVDGAADTPNEFFYAPYSAFKFIAKGPKY